MSDGKDEVLVDFTINPENRRRRMLYYKRPTGTPIPVGMKWRCWCGSIKDLTADEEQFCGKCGSRLRLQENADSSKRYSTTVVVSHFTPGTPAK